MIRKKINNDEILTSIDDTRKPEIEFRYNPSYINHYRKDFDAQPDSEFIVSLSTSKTKIDVVEYSVRPLSDWPTIVDIVITFVSLSIASGFFGQIGSDIYVALKNAIKRIAPLRNDDRGKLITTGMHIIFNYPISTRIVRVRVALKVSHLEHLGSPKLNYESLNSYLELTLPNLDAKEILIAYNENNSSWSLIYYYNLEGKFMIASRVS